MLLFEGESGADETLCFLEDKAGAGIWSFDFNNRTMAWSSGIYALLGLAPEQVTPSYAAIVALMHPDDRRSSGEFDRIVGEGLTLDRELRIIQPNGKLRWLANRSEVHLSKTGAPIRAFGILIDVTHRREIALARDAAESRFRTLVTVTDSFVWTADADGNLLDIRNWRELRGENPADLLGSRWIDLIHPDDRQRTMQEWKEAVATKREHGIEHQIRQPDGSFRWMLSRAAPVMLETGAVREWIGIASDIHERKVWPSADRSKQAMLTGAQLRAGRAIANWSVRELSEAARVSSSTIRRLEESNDAPASAETALGPIRAALESAGVEFLFPPAGRPGVRPR